MSLWQMLMIALVGFTASFYGVVSGGGGLLTIPGLVLVGLSAPSAVASSRVGLLSVSISGAARYRQAGLIDVRMGLPLMLIVTSGATVGALLLLRVNPEHFERFLGVLTIAFAPLVAFGKKLRIERPGETPSRRRRGTGYVLAFVIGIHAGLFGASWATFFTYLMVAAFGLPFLNGAAIRTFVGLAVGTVTLLIFGFGGVIAYGPALILFPSMLAGSYLGASFSLKQGEGYARHLVAVIAVVAGLKLAW